MTEAKVTHLENVRDHLNTKVQLTASVGITDLPGNLFENHTKKFELQKGDTPRELAPEEVEDDPFYQGEEANQDEGAYQGEEANQDEGAYQGEDASQGEDSYQAEEEYQE